MSRRRLMVAMPVVAGLVLTGSAAARMMPAGSVRDAVYQTCAHNGVHFNKQGHANCGLHKGWSRQLALSPTSLPPSATTLPPSGEPVIPAPSQRPADTTSVTPHTGLSRMRAAEHGHGAKTRGAQKHGAKEHGGGRSHTKHG